METKEKNLPQAEPKPGTSTATLSEDSMDMDVFKSPASDFDGVTPLSEEEQLTKETKVDELLEESIEKLKLKDKRLSGAARKRFKWLMKKGHSREEALELAKQKMPEKQANTKRLRSDDSIEQDDSKKFKPASESKAKAKVPKANPQPRDQPKASFSAALEGVKVGILPKAYPETLLTNDQLKLIQDEILEKVIEQEEAELKPRFLNSTYKPGFLVVTCANEATAEWLIGATTKIKPWEGAELKAVTDKDIPRAQILVGYFPQSEEYSNERIFKLIKAQNAGLNVSEWKVFRRAQEGSITQITISVDHPSAERLKKESYKICYRFGTASLRPRTGPSVKKPPPSTSVASKPSTSGASKGTAKDQKGDIKSPKAKGDGSKK